MEEDPWGTSALLEDSVVTFTYGCGQADTVISYLLTSGRYSRVDGQWNFQNNKTKSVLLFAFYRFKTKQNKKTCMAPKRKLYLSSECLKPLLTDSKFRRMPMELEKVSFFALLELFHFPPMSPLARGRSGPLKLVTRGGHMSFSFLGIYLPFFVVLKLHVTSCIFPIL